MNSSKRIPLVVLSAGTSMACCLALHTVQSAVSLPPPEETPEEVLRTEIITEARSPIDGKPLTTAEYAELQAQLQARKGTPQINPKLQSRIVLLRFRKLIRIILPFLPI